MSQIEIKKYISKPTTVEAIQITKDNMAEVADWCAGEVRTHKDEHGKIEKYVKVKVWRAQSEKLSQGFIGNWVLKRGTGYKVYTDKAFKSGYTDGASIPMVEDGDVNEAIFDSMVLERTKPHTTEIRMGDHVERITTPAKGVPMRGPDFGYPEGSIVMFHEPSPASTQFDPKAALDYKTTRDA